MFLDEHHIKLVQHLDATEAELYRIYRQIERLRLDLQREWRVLPSGGRWSEEAHEATEHSGKPEPA